MIDTESHIDPYLEFEKSVFSALETYSNIHRGTGHFSLVTTTLFEKARDIVLDYLKLSKRKYIVIFSTPRRSIILKQFFGSNLATILSSQDFGLSLGIRAVIVRKKMISKLRIFDTGGGIIKFVSPKSEIWSDTPDRFEAGTPNIINVIAFAKVLQLVDQKNKDLFSADSKSNLTIEDVFENDDFINLSGKKLKNTLRSSLIGSKIRVPTGEGLRRYINLDNGASTPTFIPIWEVFRKTINANKELKQKILNYVKQICADFLGAPLEHYELIFTYNTTEAINILVNLLKDNLPEESVVVNSVLDHHSNELPWRYIPGVSLLRLSVDEEGFIDLEELEKILDDFNQKSIYGKKRVFLVSMCGASNVIGTFNNLEEISRITHKYGAHLLVDGAQLVAHREISLKEVGIDFFAFSGHKIYAPFGSGALLIKKDLLSINTKVLERIKSSGEENIAGIATMGKAISLLKRIGLNIIEEEERHLTRIVLDGLSEINGIEIFGIQNKEAGKFKRRGGVLSFSLRRVPHNIVARELAEYGGIGVRNGCFCAHLLVKQILIGIHPVRQFFAKLYMMFVPTLGSIYLPGLVRVSIGLENDEKDIRFFLQILKDISIRKRASILRFLGSTHSGSGFRPHPLIPKQIQKFINTSVEKVYSI